MIKNLILKLSVLLCLFQVVLFADKGDLEKITLQLQWKHQFQFAGYYMAKEKGFYKKAGLNVDIKEFFNGMDTVDIVISNKATYGIGRPSLIIDKSNQTDVVLLSAIFQSSPHVIMATEESGIKTIKDFKNKRLMTSGDYINDVALISMVFSKKIQLKDLTFQKPSFDVKNLINGKTDLMASYISNEPFRLKKLGSQPIIFDPKDYGFDFYSDIIFTGKNEIQNYSNRAKRFNHASLKGWEYAFNNIDETVELILNKYNTQNKTKEALIYEANKLKELAYYKTNKLGEIKKEKIEKIYDIYNVMGFIKNKIDFDELIFKSKQDDLMLTHDEQKYIKKNKIVRMCNNQEYEPIEFAYNSNQNDMRGIAIDTLNLIEHKLDVKFINIPTKNWKESQQFLKDRKCDILPAAVKNTQRTKYANFTKPYLKLPIVIITHKEQKFISDFETLLDKKMTRKDGSGLINILQERYPTLQIIKTKNTRETLEYISNKKAYFTLGTVPVLSSTISKYLLEDIYITGHTDMIYNLAIAVRNDDILLLNILNKALNNITKQQHKHIYKKWVTPVVREKVIDHTLLFQISLMLLIIFLIIIYWNLKLSKVNKQLKDTQKELELLASIDPMTKLYNRRYFTSVAEHIISLAKRDKTNSSIIILDIDKFKDINDTYGHPIGDEVIKTFATTLEKICRKSDILSRWGGEEFIILLPETNIDGAFIISEKIRIQTQSMIINLPNNVMLNFTVSIGVSQVNNQTDINIESAILKADKALYKAKNSGRNQVCIEKSI